jgi:hypothetical protein
MSSDDESDDRRGTAEMKHVTPCKQRHSLDQTKYGGLIRDVANGVVAVPDTITDLLTIARDRKEIAYGGNKRERTLLTHDNDIKDPLQPYEWLNYDEWAGLSTEKREEKRETPQRKDI